MNPDKHDELRLIDEECTRRLMNGAETRRITPAEELRLYELVMRGVPAMLGPHAYAPKGRTKLP